jgi:glycosyltransferase involved in cell wall biosynthesis
LDGQAVRSAVYNRYWSTGGGAEKYGGVIAEVLASDGPLDLLTHDPVDVEWLAERLRIDLSRVAVRVLDDDGESVTRASADYDLFVNVSYMSANPAATPRSLYVVHFPTSLDGHLSLVRRAIAKRAGRLQMIGASMEWGTGFHHREAGGRGIAWTNGDGTVWFTTPPGRPLTVLFVFGHQRPHQLPPAPVRIEVDGRVATELVLSAPRSPVEARLGVAARVEVESSVADVPVQVRILSDTFVPADVVGSGDRRRLGVPLRAMHVGSPVARYSRWIPGFAAGPLSAGWTRSYGAVVSNSEFTREWVDRYWQCDSTVLYPPVTMHKGGLKEPMILSVGRFFDETQGHSKKQLELVQGFRSLHAQGVRDWTLHLVGGCGVEGRLYVERVKRAAEGLPVEFHLDASGDELESLYARASIYWHAAGLGEDEVRRPDRLEHFGITTVEAMSAGAVPIVVGLGGLRETVRHGVDGFHFRTIAGLCSESLSLITDDSMRARMASSAERRAESFSVDAFQAGLRRLIDGLPASAETMTEPQRGSHDQ